VAIPKDDVTSAYRIHAAGDPRSVGARRGRGGSEPQVKGRTDGEMRKANSRTGPTLTKPTVNSQTPPTQRTTLVYSRSQIQRIILKPSQIGMDDFRIVVDLAGAVVLGSHYK
jgi:hypothetical protein